MQSSLSNPNHFHYSPSKKILIPLAGAPHASPQPLANRFTFFVSADLSILDILFTNEIIKCGALSFSGFFHLTVFSGFILVLACKVLLFFWLNNSLLYSMPQSVHGCLVCFLFWIIVNIAAMNTHMQLFVWICFHFSPRSGNTGLYAKPTFKFLRNC